MANEEKTMKKTLLVMFESVDEKKKRIKKFYFNWLCTSDHGLVN